MSNPITKGVDSGAVPDKVKRQLFVNQLGICAEPDCMKRIMRDRTLLAECAHIIPRRVDSHPREDYNTPLEDRKKEPNLLYLCLDHHTLVDDVQHADRYTAEVLRNWKKRHEDWAAGITKNSPYLPPEFNSMLANAETQFAEQTNISAQIIESLIDTCRQFLDRHLIAEATAFLSQIDLLLLGTNNKSLIAKADLLGAILFIRNEQLPEAKQQLLQIIQANPDDAEAMLEYIELCDSAPEPTDDLENVENTVRTLANDHPRLSLIDLTRKFKKGEVIGSPNISEIWADEPRLNAKFITQYALVCDLAQNTSLRDSLINRWEQELPTSPRPHLYRAHFKVLDFLKLTPQRPEEQTRTAREVLSFTKEERDKAKAKDPQSLRDQISWLLPEIRLKFALTDFSENADHGKALRNDLLALVLKSYFDNFINGILIEFLDILRIEPDQWRAVTRKIQESQVPPFLTVVELLFLQGLQYPELYLELTTFIEKYGGEDLGEILEAIKAGDTETTAERLEAKKDSVFTLYVLESVADPEFGLALAKRVRVEDAYQVDLLYSRLQFLDPDKQGKEVLDLIGSLPLEKAGAFALRTVEQITYRHKRWHVFIPAALRLLNFEIPLLYRSQLHSLLATAYLEQGDDSNAIHHAEEALNQPTQLGEENAQILLYILGQAHARKGQYDKACETFQQHKQIKRHFLLLMQEADLCLKSTQTDRHDKALALVIEAFKVANAYDDEHYVSALTLLVELDNAGKIPRENAPIAEDGLYIKLAGLNDRWFYIGEKEKSLGAEIIKPGTPSYDAVISKALAQEIDWPPDRYSKPHVQRTILQIVTAPAFLSHRAHEAMYHLAATGNAPIWSVQMREENGSIDLSNLKQFLSEQFQSTISFFDSYTRNRVPFAFLCTSEGSLTRALGKIALERRGFIYINNSVQADIDAQKVLANNAISGSPVFVEGLATFMLASAGLLEGILTALPHIGVSTSVIKMLRDIAANLENVSNSVGSLSLVDDKLQISQRDKVGEEAFRQHLLRCAELLDMLPNKVIGKTYPELNDDDDRDFDSVLPNYFVDAFRHSQENGALILTDDSLFVQAYESLGELKVPKVFSSLSLIRTMAENKLIAWDAYLNYFARLSFYRYHLLSISDDDMLKAIFPSSPSGLVTSATQNIRLLNLPLTLSQEYGVADSTAINIVASFFTKLTLDDTVSPDLADKIFALTIVQALGNRDKNMVASEVFQLCQQNLQRKTWVIPSSQAKLNILYKQLVGFRHGLNLL